jgi:hypothetical protein
VLRSGEPCSLEFPFGGQVAINAEQFMHMMSTILIAGDRLIRSCSERILHLAGA